MRAVCSLLFCVILTNGSRADRSPMLLYEQPLYAIASSVRVNRYFDTSACRRCRARFLVRFFPARSSDVAAGTDPFRCSPCFAASKPQPRRLWRAASS